MEGVSGDVLQATFGCLWNWERPMIVSTSPAPMRRFCRSMPIALGLIAGVAFSGLGGAAAVSSPAAAKTPGKTYCFHKTCHRVKSIAETERLVGQDMTLVASHYDDCSRDRHNPCGLTSSGERFRAESADNAASPILPDGTIILAWSPASGQAAVLRINNAGPYWGNRKLDLSRAAARKLGIGGVGKVRVRVRVLKAPTKAEARYRKNRTYEPVPGPVGQFASLDEAQFGTRVLVALGAPGTDALRSPDNAAPIQLASLALAAIGDGRAAPGRLVPAFTPPDDGFKAAIEAQALAEADAPDQATGAGHLAARLAAKGRPIRLTALDEGLVASLVQEVLEQHHRVPHLPAYETPLRAAPDAVVVASQSGPAIEPPPLVEIRSIRSSKRKSVTRAETYSRAKASRASKHRVAKLRRLARERRIAAIADKATSRSAKRMEEKPSGRVSLSAKRQKAAAKARAASSVSAKPARTAGIAGWTAAKLNTRSNDAVAPGAAPLIGPSRIRLPADPLLMPERDQRPWIRTQPSALA